MEPVLQLQVHGHSQAVKRLPLVTGILNLSWTSCTFFFFLTVTSINSKFRIKFWIVRDFLLNMRVKLKE